MLVLIMQLHPLLQKFPSNELNLPSLSSDGQSAVCEVSVLGGAMPVVTKPQYAYVQGDNLLESTYISIPGRYSHIN